MKALVYTQPTESQLQQRPRPELVEGEVVLKIDAVGICGSDMPGMATIRGASRSWCWVTNSLEQ